LFKKALSLNPEDTDCYIELAQLLEYKKPEESLKIYEEALKIIKNKQKRNVNERKKQLFNTDDILPELYNNIACIRIRANSEDTETIKYLNESLNSVKVQRDEINKLLLNTTDNNENYSLENKVSLF
jgi:hypothetical protein